MREDSIVCGKSAKGEACLEPRVTTRFIPHQRNLFVVRGHKTMSVRGTISRVRRYQGRPLQSLLSTSPVRALDPVTKK